MLSKTSDRKTVFFLAGNFGVGKTSIVKYKTHIPMNGSPNTLVGGFISLGGENGADYLGHKQYNKRKTFTKILPEYKEYDFLVHSNMYAYLIDVQRFLQTHDYVLLYLDTAPKVAMERIIGRGGKFSFKTYQQQENKNQSLKQYCEYLGLEVYTINNNNPFPTPAESVWAILKNYLKRYGKQ